MSTIKKLSLIIGIMFIIWGVIFIMVSIPAAIVMLLISAPFIYFACTQDSLSKKELSSFLFLAMAREMQGNKYKFLELLKEEKDYKVLKDYYNDLFFCSQNYIRRLSLEAINFTPKRPINPYTAAGIGSAIAGPVGAYISYSDAVEANEKYRQMMDSTNEIHHKYEDSLTDYEKCFYKIEEILLKYDKTKEIWLQLREKAIKEEVDSLSVKYKLRY